MAKKGRTSRSRKPKKAETYKHPEAESPLRPDIGTQSQFKKRKPPKTYKYDSSLSPELNWDGQNPAREQGEKLIKNILDAKDLADAKGAAEELKKLSEPFLNWAGKAERLSFDVATLPLFVHERLSTKAIIETLKGHRRDKQMTLDLFGDPQHSITDQVLKAYEYMDKWVNRMILGDSLQVMNSLLHYEGMGGQVQMIYVDPPYGVKFGSNFQPFVRKRDVKHNDDDFMTREPEMVKAYRDTWELGLHSYLTYIKDRLFLCKDLLNPTGSIFVQIGDENVHHVREIMDEVFGADNFVSIIAFRKGLGYSQTFIPSVYDYLLVYAKDKPSLKYRKPLLSDDEEDFTTFSWIELSDGSATRLRQPDFDSAGRLKIEGKLFQSSTLMSKGASEKGSFGFEFDGKIYHPSPGAHWKTNQDGLKLLAKANRLIGVGDEKPIVSPGKMVSIPLTSTSQRLSLSSSGSKSGMESSGIELLNSVALVRIAFLSDSLPLEDSVDASLEREGIFGTWVTTASPKLATKTIPRMIKFVLFFIGFSPKFIVFYFHLLFYCVFILLSFSVIYSYSRSNIHILLMTQ